MHKKSLALWVGWAYSPFLLSADYFRILIHSAQRNERYNPVSKKKIHNKKTPKPTKKQTHPITENPHTASFAPTIPKWLSEDFQSGRHTTLLSRNPFQKKSKSNHLLWAWRSQQSPLWEGRESLQVALHRRQTFSGKKLSLFPCAAACNGSCNVLEQQLSPRATKSC